jgi:putative ATP-dependent endonuclease of the OLD family
LQLLLHKAVNTKNKFMKISNLKIQNFRGIKSTDLLFPDHVVLIGDNNTGKSTIFEALDLALGPDRLNRRSVVDEHDFYNGNYLAAEEGEEAPKIEIEVTVIGLNTEQQIHFKDYIEWWCNAKQEMHTAGPPETVDNKTTEPALRVSFFGEYDPEEDDFTGSTYFTRSLAESVVPQPFKKKDKHKCGFLYLRSLRTGSRALSLESGSLLDIILRIKEIRPQMWESTITELNKFDVATDPTIGISGVLESIEKAIKKYVPREWGVSPHLKVSNLTREHLRKVITAFIATGEGDHAAPFYRQGTGTINILVLAMLSQIAEDKQNVIFAMEEPETAIPPYTQKRIVHEIKKLSAQSFFTSHSPYILEEFELEETVVLHRKSDGVMEQSHVELPDSIKHKKYRQDFRKRFCEGLLSRRLLVTEGATEATALPAVARRLSELNPDVYLSLEGLGICIVDAESESKIADLSELYAKLNKRVFAICDKQEEADKQKIEEKVEKLFMHEEKGFEDLVLKNTTQPAIDRFIDWLDWPPHLQTQFPNPKDSSHDALKAYFSWSKGSWGLADFLAQCNEDEIPQWLKDMCLELKKLIVPQVDDETGTNKDVSDDEDE